jgi:molecular chaperone DnaK (HSP70)
MREIEHSGRPANITGIDLGTTETRVARFAENGHPEITLNSELNDVTASVVQIDDLGKVIVGNEAKKFLFTGTENVFAEFRRDIGTDRSWLAGASVITPVTLTALLLKKVVADYAEQFGQPRSIVITWPANFRNEQREATKTAARLAGLTNPLFIEEPVATAIYYARSQSLQGKYLIYDFGGTSFNVSLIESRDNTISVLNQDGIQQLGEKDLNHVLLRIIGEKFRAKTGHEFDAVDCNFDRLAIESNFSTLRTRPTVQTRLTSGRHGPLSIEVSRSEFESGAAHLIEQAEMACENVLRCGHDDPARHTKKSEIQEIFMTGTATHVPALQASVARLFGKNPLIEHPEQAVALGAAIYAAHKASGGSLNTLQSCAVSDIDVTHVAPHYFGLIYTNWLTGESTNITVIPKGEKLPFRKAFKIKADARGFTPPISLTQSAIEESNPDFVTRIWSGDLQCGAPFAEIELLVYYDEHGMMGCSVTDIASGKCTTVDLQPG